MSKAKAAEKNGHSKKNGKALSAAVSAGAAKSVLPSVSPLHQDPHAVRDTREKVLEVAIGREVRAFRKKLGITVADLASATDISLGMLSKIENGITSPSLTTLQALSRALGVPVTASSAASRRSATPFSSRPAKASTSSVAARAPATSTRCSAISAPTHRRNRRTLSDHAVGGFRRVPDLPA
jgi:transcriptional regulator with XRE-family HTH domain